MEYKYSKQVQISHLQIENAKHLLIFELLMYKIYGM